MQAHDWNSFTLRVPIKSTVETIYKAWSTSNGLEIGFYERHLLQKVMVEQENI